MWFAQGHWRCDSSRVARAFSMPNYVFSRVEQGCDNAVHSFVMAAFNYGMGVLQA